MLIDINFVWIKKNKDSSEFVWNTSIEKIFEWEKLNPNTNIRLWYHGAFCTPDQVRNSIDFFKKSSSSVKLVDIKKLLLEHKLLEHLFTKPQVSVYWKADVVRFAILNWCHKNTDSDVSCYSDLDLDASDIACSLQANTSTFSRLDQFGALFCRSDKTTLNFENGFIIMLHQRAKSLINAMQIVMIEWGCLVMDLLFRICPSTDVLEKHVKLYSINEWGFTRLSLTFHVDTIIRHNNLTHKHFWGLSLEPKSLSIVINNEKPVSLETFDNLVHEYPVLLLGAPVFFEDPKYNYTLNSYKNLMSFKTRACNIGTNCSISSFTMTPEEIEQKNNLYDGMGHSKLIVEEISKVNLPKDDELFTLVINSSL